MNMKQVLIVVGLVVALTVAIGVYVNSEQSETIQNELMPSKETTTKFEVISVGQAIQEFDQRLVAKVSKHGAEPLTAYVLTEGVPFGMSTGTYVVCQTEDGNILWFVHGIIDGGLRVSTIEVVAYVKRLDWKQAIADANENDMQMPSLRIFVPDRYMQVKVGEVAYSGIRF